MPKYINKNAEKWLKMLEGEGADELLQAQQKLQVGDGYCCLGVGQLCHQMNTGEVQWNVDVDGNIGGGVLTPPTQKWLGLKYSSGAANSAGFLSLSLTHLNDNKGYTFKQIASHLRANAEHYFVEVK